MSQNPGGPAERPGRRPGFRRRLGLAALTTSLAIGANARPAPAHPASPGLGTPGMSPHRSGTLLVDYYAAYLKDHNIDRFREKVAARYGEGTLARIVSSGDLPARRAAVLALGLIGSFAVNADVARALQDKDATVRDLADNALWAIWFRADTPEHNARLELVRDLNNRRLFPQAIAEATRLVADAPEFAEAYNQRAIAHFLLDRFEDSATDCQQAIRRNPYHLGALSGLAQCQLQLDRPDDALRTFRRILKLQPFNENVRKTVSALEARED